MNCKHCGKPVSRKPKIYCDNICQQAYQNQQKIDKWLETGIVVVGSGRNHYVRTYIMKEQNDQCALCQMGPIWQDKDLIFILDHIDGDSTNNRRENLRLVCPNCDSQLDTFKAKNKGKGRHSRRQRYADGLSY